MEAKESLKQQVAQAVIPYIEPDSVIGVGTGSTVDTFIAALSASSVQIAGAVASSQRSQRLLEKAGIEIIDPNVAPPLPLYIDGADEVDPAGYCIKGGGGAMTLEKVVAAIAERFICIVDASKCVAQLGRDFPIAIEVLPAARSLVGRACVRLGGNPVYRSGFVTDSGNMIIDVFGLDTTDIFALDQALHAVPGVVGHGLFVAQRPHTILIAQASGVETRMVTR